ncbi:hypothetical protein ACTHGN_005874 [Pseudomonas putida]
MEISFDKEIAVAKIQMADWPPPLVEHLGRYFDVREGMLRLDYAHLDVDGTHVFSDWGHNERERFEFNLEIAKHESPIALTFVLLGYGNSGIKGSSSILDQCAYPSALQALRREALDVDCRALRATILDGIAPSQSWVSWLLDTRSIERAEFLKDRQIMSALVNRTSQENCTVSLKLVTPGKNQDGWAFEQLVVQHWEYLLGCLMTRAGMSSGYSKDLDRNFVMSLFENSLTVQEDRRAGELLLDRIDPHVFPQSIQYCRTLMADDVRKMFQSWHSQPKAGKKDDFKACVAQACLTLAKSLPDSMPSDLALAAAWHELMDPARSDQKRVAETLKELPSGMWDQGALWSQLGPAAREAWRQGLFDQVWDNQELAHGLLAFCCLWLPQLAFAEVEPVILRLMVDEDCLAFATQLVSTGPRQVELRVNGLMRQSLGVPDFEGPVNQGEDTSTLPGIGAKTWLCDLSVERVIHKALSQMEDDFCRDYQGTWGEDEEFHTARLLAHTQEAISKASRQLHQLNAMTRANYPSLSVVFRQPGKREEGAITPAGARLSADILFLTRIVDDGKTLIQRATLLQVKKRFGKTLGNGFRSTIGIDLEQCDNLLKQSEHAYYLFTTPPSPRSALWVAPARLVGNLTQLNTSKTSVVAWQVRDASRSYADFFLYGLIGLWAGDEDENIVAIANGDARRGLTPRHIVEIEVRRPSG